MPKEDVISLKFYSLNASITAYPSGAPEFTPGF
jgi:hypothetical protein